MIEIGMYEKDSTSMWNVSVYNQKYGGVILEREKQFASKEEARCWFETVATLEKEYEKSFYGQILTEQDIEYAEKLLDFKYSDVI